VALAVLVAMGWTLRRGKSSPSGPVDPSPSSTDGPQKTRTTGLVLRSYKEGQQSFLVEAESSSAQEGAETKLSGVKVSFGFVARGKPETSLVTADDGVYDPSLPRVVFHGHVVVTTSDGFEFKSESLTYRGDKQIAKTQDHAEFRRKAVSGSSMGLVYAAADGRLELPADAFVRIESKTQPATEIRSRSAVLERSEGTLRFEDDTRLVQGSDNLSSTRLILSFDPATEVLYRMVAAGGVEMNMKGARALPGGLDLGGSTGGPRHLVCRRLEIALRPDRSIQQIVAQSDVDLTLLPGPGQQPERRRVVAKRYLIMDADDKGRATAVRAGQDVALTAEAFPPRSAAPPRGVTCNRFEAAVDPVTGRATAADFAGGVEFTRGDQRARGETAHYDGARATLALGDRPSIRDGNGTLEATEIFVGSESGDVTAEGDVRHLLRQRGSEQAGLFASGDKPTIIAARSFSSSQKRREAMYKGDAILRSGRSEVRADTIVIQEDPHGLRNLHATDGVVSLLARDSGQPKVGPAAALALIEGRGDSMTYDEAKGVVVYTGNAMVRQGDIVTRSPTATLTLTSDLKDLEKLVAGEPVEVAQGTRHATGRLGTYTPADHMMLLVGNPVVLTDGKQKTTGRSVAFSVGGDRIIVDGQEEGRTESVFEQGIGSGRP
jgi:lipopolysaccharide transport protein LptA/LPS export ABC transporter protein LptC